MQILVVYTGDYGLRHLANIRLYASSHWHIHEWRSVTSFPIVIDDPVDFLPADLPPTDLLISFAEHPRALLSYYPNLPG